MTSLGVQIRVLKVLVRREIALEYGRRDIGFLWIFVEPCLFVVSGFFMHSLMQISLFFFSQELIEFGLMGLGSVMVFRNVVIRGCLTFRGTDEALLIHRNISVFDLFVAKIFFRGLGSCFALHFLLLVCATLELLPWPRDFLMFTIAAIYNWVFFGSLGVGFGVLVMEYPRSKGFVNRVAMLLMMMCMVFFRREWIPDTLHLVADILPTTHAVGFLRSTINPYGDFNYNLYYSSLFGLACLCWGLFRLRKNQSVFGGG